MDNTNLPVHKSGVVDSEASYHTAISTDPVQNHKSHTAFTTDSKNEINVTCEKKSRATTAKPMSANYFSKDCVVNKEYFYQENGEHTEKKREELVHIIQTLNSSDKRKKIKIEEIFEILDGTSKSDSFKKFMEFKQREVIQDIPDVKQPQRHRFSKTSIMKKSKSSTNSDFTDKKNRSLFDRQQNQKKVALKPNSGRSRPLKRPEIAVSNNQNGRQSNVCSQPYMLNAKSRKQVKGNGSRTRKPKVSDMHLNGQTNSPFEVKFVAPVFIRTSDVSLSEYSPTMTNRIFEYQQNPEILEKYQTEPKKAQIHATQGESDENLLEEELALFFRENPYLKQADRRKLLKPNSLFERLKGDERDLPGIYSRFVRRSKGVTSKSSNNDLMNYEEMKNLILCTDNNTNTSSEILKADDEPEREDYVSGKLICNTRVSKGPKDMNNEKPLSYDKEVFSKVKKNQSLTRKDGVSDIFVSFRKNKDSQIINNKRKDKSHGNIKEKATADVSDENINTKQFQAKKTVQKAIKNRRKSFSRRKLRKVVSTDLHKGEKPADNSGVVQDYDPMKENLSMSPTAAITMMVLAADKLVGGTSQFFENEACLQSTIKG